MFILDLFYLGHNCCFLLKCTKLMNILVFYSTYSTSSYYFHLTAELFARHLIIKTLGVQLKSIAVTVKYSSPELELEPELAFS